MNSTGTNAGTESRPASTLSEPADADLVLASLDGREDAFRILVRRYQRPVFACAWSVLRHKEDAADACQETFIRFHRNLAQYDLKRPLQPYLLTIAFNCARNLRRSRERTEPAASAPDLRLDQVAAGTPSPMGQVLTQERQAAIQRLVGGLPTTLRDVCCLFYLRGRDCREVADILRMTEGAVKVALHRARKQLLQRGISDWRPT